MRRAAGAPHPQVPRAHDPGADRRCPQGRGAPDGDEAGGPLSALSASTAFYLHPAAALHDTGWGHPEHQGRLRGLTKAVGRDLLALHGRVEQAEASLGEGGSEAVEEALLRVHATPHVERVRDAVERAAREDGRVALDADTVVSAASWDAATGSVEAALAAVEAVSDGRYANAFVAQRPPGHHATPGRAMGFCLFNGAAVAARHLQARGLAERVLILDWDVHHGNGTQDAFYDDPSVFYLSLHQWPWYPGTGAADETGEGKGEGATLNVALEAGTPRETWRRRFEEALEAAGSRFTPEFVLVSAGFDVLAGDPLGGQLLEPADLHAVTLRVREWAEEACGGRLVTLLEGGYVPERLGAGAVAVIRALAGIEPEGE